MTRGFRAPPLRRALLAVAAGAGAALAPMQLAGGAVPAPRATFGGFGFDACTVPSVAQLNALKAGPYRAIAVYVGGANAACPARLSPSWVRGATKAGWSVIPTYVGLQAPIPRCPCRTISLAHAIAEGQAAAVNAISIMSAMGIGRGNVVYDDVEGYTRGPLNTSSVLGFLAGWAAGLVERGYVSGVYASASSGIADLVAEAEHDIHRWPLPRDIWIADWNGQHTVSDPWVPKTLWADHQRLHQYNGGQDIRYGGVTLNIDGDYCNGAVVTAASL